MKVPADVIREACDREIAQLDRDIARLQVRLRQVQYDRDECRLRAGTEVDDDLLCLRYTVVRDVALIHWKVVNVMKPERRKRLMDLAESISRDDRSPHKCVVVADALIELLDESSDELNAIQARLFAALGLSPLDCGDAIWRLALRKVECLVKGGE